MNSKLIHVTLSQLYPSVQVAVVYKAISSKHINPDDVFFFQISKYWSDVLTQYFQFIATRWSRLIFFSVGYIPYLGNTLMFYPHYGIVSLKL